MVTPLNGKGKYQNFSFICLQHAWNCTILILTWILYLKNKRQIFNHIKFVQKNPKAIQYFNYIQNSLKPSRELYQASI